MRAHNLRLGRIVRLESLSEEEKSLFCEYLSKDRIDAALRARMKKEVMRQSREFVDLQLPRDTLESRQRRAEWRMLVRGPLFGWEQRGRRIRRRWDPARRRVRLRFGLMLVPGDGQEAKLDYEGDLFEWWILRLVLTRGIRHLFECWYCGKIAWGRRSTARFCATRCRMRYHLAIGNQKRLRALPSGRQRVMYAEMRKKAAEIGLSDTPRWRRVAEEVRQKHLQRRT